MNVLGSGDIYAEAQDDAQVNPPENGVEGFRSSGSNAHAGKRVAQHAANRNGGFRTMSAGCDIKGVDQEGGYHQARGESHHNHSVDISGEVKTEAVGFGRPPTRQHPAQDCQDQDGIQVQVYAVNPYAGCRPRGRHSR